MEGSGSMQRACGSVWMDSQAVGFKEGSTFWIHRGPGKPYKAHVLAIVDQDWVVFKWYGRHKQWWHYNVDHKSGLRIQIEHAKEVRGLDG